MKKESLQIAFLGMLFLLQSMVVQATDSLSLKQCMEYAVDNSMKIKIQRSEQFDARLQRRDAILQTFTPRVTAGTSVYYNFGRAVDPESNTYTDVTSFNNNYALNASMTLFDGFTSINHIRMANTMIKMGVSEEQKLQNELCLSVMEAYFNVQFQLQMKEVLHAQVAAAKENVKLVTIQYEQGQKGYADKVQLEAELAEKEYQWIATENKYNDALLTLKDLMLWPMDEELSLRPIPSVYGSKGDVLEQDVALLQTLPIHAVDEISAYAKEFHPTSLIARREMERARLDLKSARGAFFPTLSLGGGWSTNYYTYPGKDDYHAASFHSQFTNNRGSYVQLSLSFPIYDRLFTASNLSRKKNAYRRAKIRYEQTQRDIELEVSRAVQDCKGAFQASVHAEKHTMVQEESYRLGQRKMAQGLLSPVEYHSIAGTYLQAKAEQLNARFTYLLKQSVVNYYKGISYIDQLK